MNKAILITAMLLFSCVVLNAQANLETIIKRVQNRYVNAETYSMKLRLDVFNDKGSVSNTMFGDVYSGKEGYFTDFNGNKSLYNANCLLQVDEHSRNVYYKHVAPGQLQKNVPAMIGDQLKILESYAPKVKKQPNGDIKIVLTDPDQMMYDKMEVWFHPDYSMYKVIYHYANSEQTGVSKSEITFYDIHFNTEIPGEVFKETRYIQYTSSGVRLNTAYHNYTLKDVSGDNQKL